MNGSINVSNTSSGVYINGSLYPPGVYNIDGNRYEVGSRGVVCRGGGAASGPVNNPWTWFRASMFLGALVLAALLTMW